MAVASTSVDCQAATSWSGDVRRGAPAARAVVSRQWWLMVRASRATVVAMASSDGRCQVRQNIWSAGTGETDNKKRKGFISEFAHIHRFTDKYRRAIPISLAPFIFVCEVTSPTNITTYIHRWHGLTDEPMRLVKVNYQALYICQCQVQTDRRKLDSSISRTDECILN
jgi:hypothetical protein